MHSDYKFILLSSVLAIIFIAVLLAFHFYEMAFSNYKNESYNENVQQCIKETHDLEHCKEMFKK